MSDKNNSFGIFSDLLFPKIFQTFRIARHHTKLMIAFAAFVVIFMAGSILDLNKTVVASPGSQPLVTELQIYLTRPSQLQSFIQANKEKGPRTGVFSVLWLFAHERFHIALESLFAFNLPAAAASVADYCKAVGWAFRYHTVYCIILSAIKLAVIAIAGGAICRIAALQFARGEKPGLTEALRFSTQKFFSFLAAPLLPVAVIFFFAVCVALVGLFGFIPYVGELLIGFPIPIPMLLVLLAGFIMALLVIGTAAGYNLMFPVIAYENSDCFEAVEKSFTYVFRRPWHMVFYYVFALFYGAVCYVFVRFFAFLLVFCAHQALPLGVRFVYWLPARICSLFGVEFAPAGRTVEKLLAIWPQPTFLNLLGASVPAANWSQAIAAFVIKLCLFFIAALVMAFVVSFYFSANTIIYSLLRKGVDGVALENVHTELEEAESPPANSKAEMSSTQSQSPPSD